MNMIIKFTIFECGLDKFDPLLKAETTTVATFFLVVNSNSRNRD